MTPAAPFRSLGIPQPRACPLRWSLLTFTSLVRTLRLVHFVQLVAAAQTSTASTELVVVSESIFVALSKPDITRRQ
eukprot:5014061-Prymnesium_polylepis.1